MKITTAFFNRSYLFLCYAIIFGTTLLFSTSTRSVFEVNKLGVIKISLSLLGILFFYDRLIGNQTWFQNFKDNLFFNSSLVLLWTSNAISTITSKNVTVSIFGCYDRWEGIITSSFYIFMT